MVLLTLYIGTLYRHVGTNIDFHYCQFHNKQFLIVYFSVVFIRDISGIASRTNTNDMQWMMGRVRRKENDFVKYTYVCTSSFEFLISNFDSPHRCAERSLLSKEI